MSSAVERLEVCPKGVVGLAGDVALEATDDLAFVQAIGAAPAGVRSSALAVAQPSDGDPV
jgi:hypothetical protein